MNKIPLFIGKSLGFDRDMIVFSVKYGNLPNFFTKAILDTGCPFTIISESTIKKTRIPYSDKPTKFNVQLGTIPLDLKELGGCEISLRDEKNESLKFKQELFVGIPSVRGYISQELPSLVGKDFLNKHSLSIINKKEGNYLLLDSE